MCARTRFQEGNFKEARISKALGILWCQKGQYRLAVRELYHAVRLENKCFGALHPNVVNTFRNMSVPYCRLNKVSKAVQLNQVALQIKKRWGVSMDEETADLHHNLALALSNLRDASKFRAEVDYHEEPPSLS